MEDNYKGLRSYLEGRKYRRRRAAIARLFRAAWYEKFMPSWAMKGKTNA